MVVEGGEQRRIAQGWPLAEDLEPPACTSAVVRVNQALPVLSASTGFELRIGKVPVGPPNDMGISCGPSCPHPHKLTPLQRLQLRAPPERSLAPTRRVGRMRGLGRGRPRARTGDF